MDYQYQIINDEEEEAISPTERWTKLSSIYKKSFEKKMKFWNYLYSISLALMILFIIIGFLIILIGFIEGYFDDFKTKFLPMPFIGSGLVLLGVFSGIIWYFIIRKKIFELKDQYEIDPINIINILTLNSWFLSFPPKFPPKNAKLVETGYLKKEIYDEMMTFRSDYEMISEKLSPFNNISIDIIRNNTYYNNIYNNIYSELNVINDNWRTFRFYLELDMPNPVLEDNTLI